MSDMLEMTILRDLTPEEQLLFMNEMGQVRKSKTTAILLALFLGGVGAHRYYMGDIAWGVIYTVFCWTFIPGLAAFVELFLLSDRVRRHNEKMAQAIAMKIKTIYRKKADSEPTQLQSQSESNDNLAS